MAVRSLTVLLVLAALLGGCGGDDGPQTKEDFIAAADTVCAELAGEFADSSTADPRTPQEVAAANGQLADLYEKLEHHMRDVRLPASGAARTGAQRFVASLRAAQPAIAALRAASKDFVDAAESGDEQAVRTSGNDVRAALDSFRAARASSDRLAVLYGLNLCGNLG